MHPLLRIPFASPQSPSPPIFLFHHRGTTVPTPTRVFLFTAPPPRGRCTPAMTSGSVAEASPPATRRCAARCTVEEAGAKLNGDADHRRERELRLLTIPTLLTLGRVAAVPLLVSTYHMNGWWATTATTGLFLAAAITDWLDGYIARKMRLGTAFGAFLDPVADKLMVAATLVLLCTKPLEVGIFGEVPWLLTVPSIAIICREITMSAVREWAASKNSRVLEQAVSVNSFGKWKTATQMIALTILLATRDPSLAGPGITVGFGVVLLYISAGLALLSLAVYMRKIWKTLVK